MVVFLLLFLLAHHDVRLLAGQLNVVEHGKLLWARPHRLGHLVDQIAHVRVNGYDSSSDVRVLEVVLIQLNLALLLNHLLDDPLQWLPALTRLLLSPCLLPDVHLLFSAYRSVEIPLGAHLLLLLLLHHFLDADEVLLESSLLLGSLLRISELREDLISFLPHLLALSSHSLPALKGEVNLHHFAVDVGVLGTGYLASVAFAGLS